jgi:hypothetical protein
LLIHLAHQARIARREAAVYYDEYGIPRFGKPPSSSSGVNPHLDESIKNHKSATGGDDSDDYVDGKRVAVAPKKKHLHTAGGVKTIVDPADYENGPRYGSSGVAHSAPTEVIVKQRLEPTDDPADYENGPRYGSSNAVHSAPTYVGSAAHSAPTEVIVKQRLEPTDDPADYDNNSPRYGKASVIGEQHEQQPVHMVILKKKPKTTIVKNVNTTFVIDNDRIRDQQRITIAPSTTTSRPSPASSTNTSFADDLDVDVFETSQHGNGAPLQRLAPDADGLVTDLFDANSTTTTSTTISTTVSNNTIDTITGDENNIFAMFKKYNENSGSQQLSRSIIEGGMNVTTVNSDNSTISIGNVTEFNSTTSDNDAWIIAAVKHTVLEEKQPSKLIRLDGDSSKPQLLLTTTNSSTTIGVTAYYCPPCACSSIADDRSAATWTTSFRST